jgi:tetratricopeptide (TPR) repeat protein
MSAERSATIETLEAQLQRAPADARTWQRLGFAYRDEQRMPESMQAFARAMALAPDDALSALAHAEGCLESGLPAAALARRALALAPGDPAAIGCCASALAAEGQRRAAENLLTGALVQRPDWLEGHKLLAALRYTGGDEQEYARSYAAAVRILPQHLPLRMAWFRSVAQARNWEAAIRIIEDCERSFGAQPAFTIARLFVASESGNAARAAALFAATTESRDAVRDLAWVRHCLRGGDAQAAEAAALRLTEGSSARLAWPYLSLIWRLTDNPRAAWLEGSPPFVRCYDLEFEAGGLGQLAALLRSLHTARAPYLEQSVRGGTQTDRPLFFRHEPIIAALKTRVLAAVREYVESLPPFEAGHPLLGTAREQLLFAGSWSVRLQGQGFHVSHTHPRGWISSALYVALPDAASLGVAPAGWLEFGTAPPELNLRLAPLLQVEPKPGRLVLFPSTLWHATVPFQDGERLTIAFDVATPGH